MLTLNGISQKIRENLYLILILLFSLALIAVNYIWVTRDIAPPPWDQAWYLETSENLYQALREDGVFGLVKSFSHALNGAKAPLISILPLPFYLLFGNSELSAMCVNFSFLLLLSYFLFRLVEFISNKKVAFLSVLITQTMPLFIGINRQFYVEYGLTTLVIMFLFFLVKSDYLQNKRYNIGIGILLGLGLLMKSLFILYIAAPALWILYLRNKYKSDIFKPYFLLEILKIAVIGFLICAIWYIPNIKSIVSFAVLVGFGGMAGHYGSRDIFSWGIISNYWKMLINACASFYYFMIALISAVLRLGYSFFGGESEKLIKNGYKGFLFVWFFIPFMVFTFGINKDMRFIMPVLPVLSVFASLMICGLLSRVKSSAIYWIVCILIIAYPSYVIFGNSFIDKAIARDFKTIYTPDTTDWKANEIIEYIYRETYKQNNPSSWTIVALEHPYLNYNTYAYIASSKHYTYPLQFVNLGYDQSDINKTVETFFSYFKPSFVIVQEGISSALIEWANKANDEVRKRMDNKELPYGKDKVFELSNGVKIILYKRLKNT